MWIGVNWTSPHNFPLISELVKTGDVDFCELLIDNFLIYEPEVLRDSLATSSCAFHIMNSHFLHREIDELKEYAQRIKKAMAVLKPLYVSDHIGLFKQNHRYFPFMQEIIYDDFFDTFKERALMWGDMMESYIYYENFPSFQEQPLRQIDFYQRLQSELSHQANILFDISNAVIAEKNGCDSIKEWVKLAKMTNHFHVAGYEKAGSTPYYLDSHNQAIAEDTIEFIHTLKPMLTESSQKTLVVERDFNLDFSQWHHDIKKIKDVLTHG